MSKYVRKARRREIAFAGSQLTFDFSARPGEFVPDSKVAKTERRLMLRTDDASVRHLAERRADASPGDDPSPCPVTVINDFISSRRGKRDDANEHGLWTRYDIMSHDLDEANPRRRKNGVKARLLTKEYPEGILVTCHSVQSDPGSPDPLTFTVNVTRD